MRLINFRADWQQLSAASRVLVINGFSFNLGFYMLLPYLAEHLQSALHLSSWHVGLVIGLRVLSQQGLFLVGGTLGDYLGYKRLILLGCLVRVGGFLLLGFSHNLGLLLLGAFLTGFAGALFTPSSNAYLAHEAVDQASRNRLFAMQSWMREAGMLLGPLVGLTLISFDFFWVGLSSALMFLLLFVIQWYYLPSLSVSSRRGRDQHFLQQWQSMLANSAFLRFIACACAFHLFFHQLYLALPSEVASRGLGSDVITWVFITTSVLGISLQLPISHWVARSFGRANAMGLGLLLMGASFLWFLSNISGWPWLSFIGFAATFSIGSMLVLPLLEATVPHFAQRSELASYYGLYSCFGGIAAFTGNLLVGWLLSLEQLAAQWIWLGLAGVGLLAGFSLYRQVHQLADKAPATVA